MLKPDLQTSFKSVENLAEAFPHYDQVSEHGSTSLDSPPTHHQPAIPQYGAPLGLSPPFFRITVSIHRPCRGDVTQNDHLYKNTTRLAIWTSPNNMGWFVWWTFTILSLKECNLWISRSVYCSTFDPLMVGWVTSSGRRLPQRGKKP